MSVSTVARVWFSYFIRFSDGDGVRRSIRSRYLNNEGKRMSPPCRDIMEQTHRSSGPAARLVGSERMRKGLAISPSPSRPRFERESERQIWTETAGAVGRQRTSEPRFSGAGEGNERLSTEFHKYTHVSIATYG